MDTRIQAPLAPAPERARLVQPVLDAAGDASRQEHHHQDHDGAVGPQRAKPSQQRDGGDVVEAGERFVQQDETRPLDERALELRRLTEEHREAWARDLRRALEAIPDELKTNGEAGLNGLIEGVEMTERSMLSTLERHGVKKIDAEGQKFDPNRHQAMYEIEDASVPSGSIVQVMQAGYVIGERVLRPALVGVSKGGAKAAPAAATNGGESNSAA